MEEITTTVLLEHGFNALLVLIFIIGIGYGLYKFGKLLLGMFQKFLDGLLSEFKEMISSIKNLGKDEKESSEKHSKEHTIIIEKLDKLIDKK